MTIRRMLALALLAVTACAKGQSARPADDGWYALATAAPQSPAKAAPGDLTAQWAAADGRPVSITVARPRNPDRKVVSVAPGGNDLATIGQALATLKGAGGGTLKLAPGTYQLANASGQPALVLDGVNDVLIDGPGAKIVFAQWGTGLTIRTSNRVMIRGVSFGYAQPAVVRATVRKDQAGTSLDFGDGPGPRDGQTIHQISKLDAAAGRYAGGQSRFLFGKSGLAAGDRQGNRARVSDPQLDALKDGDAVAVKLSYYQGALISVADPGPATSNDIVFDGITVRDTPGMGVAVQRMGRGLAIVGSTFGVTGDGAATIAYDAVHVVAAVGDILIQNNHFRESGDDAINLASPIYDATSGGDGKSAQVTLKGGGGAKGADFAFFDANLGYLGHGRIVSRSPSDASAKTTMQLDAAIPNPGTVRYARDTGLLSTRYAVIGNDIANCECHAILAQGPNGLVRGNVIHDIRFNAIRIVTSAMWHEGAGAQNVVVEANEIRGSSDDARRGIVWAAITVYGEIPGSQPMVTDSIVHAHIAIRDNQIANVAEGCISVASARDVSGAHNSCIGFNTAVNRQRLLIERADPVAGAARMAAKSAYLVKGDGLWVDPRSTADISLTQ